MKLLTEILALHDVEGAVLFSPAGELLSWDFSPALNSKLEQGKWRSALHPDGLHKMIQSFEGMEEVELFFSEKKVLIRRAGNNYLLIVMARSASTDMARLVSDTLMPHLRKAVKSKKFGSFFRF